MNCDLILLDEVNCKFNNLHGEIINHFFNMFNYEVPGAMFSAKVKLGMWDGKVSLFDKNGVTFINFLPLIIPVLVDELGVKINVDDRRIRKTLTFEPIDENLLSHIIHPERCEPIKLRDYQVEMVNILLSGHIGGIGVAGTGAGKTIITAAIAYMFNQKGMNCLVIVPSTSLVKQTKKGLEDCGLDVGEFSGKVKDTKNNVIVATWQTLQNIPQFVAEFGMVLVDEAHGAKSKVVKDLLSITGRHIQYRFGVTATIPKPELDRQTIFGVLGNVRHEIPSHELIAAGHLAGLEIEITQLIEDFHEEYQEYVDSLKAGFPAPTYAQWKAKYFIDYNAEKSFIRGHTKRTDYIARQLVNRSLVGNGNVFALVDSVAFGKKLTKAVRSHTETEHVYFVHGQDKVEDRQEIYDLFKDNDGIIVIATVHCAGTGIDISRIYNLALIDLGKSFIRTLQTIGRGLRKADDKMYLLAWDVSSDLKYSKRHLGERIKFYKEAKYPHKKTKVDY